MVDLDSNPTKLIEIVEIGKQLLITRGSLTTFSIANDVAKYFAIIPAMFVVAYPAAGHAQRHAAAHSRVRDPVGGDLQRADHHRADSAGAARRALHARRPRPMLRRNLVIYGLGGSSRRSSASSSSTCSCAPDPRHRLKATSWHPTPRPSAVRHACGGTSMLIVLTVVLGVVYPLAMTAVGQVEFAGTRRRFLVRSTGRTVSAVGSIADSPVDADGTRRLVLPEPALGSRPRLRPARPRPRPTSARQHGPAHGDRASAASSAASSTASTRQRAARRCSPGFRASTPTSAPGLRLPAGRPGSPGSAASASDW